MRTIRIALRTLLRRPSFAVIAVLTLTLGLGGTAAIYTLVDEVVLDPLPYPDPGALVAVDHPAPKYGAGHWGLSEAGWFTLLDGNRTLEGLAVYQRFDAVLGGAGQAEQVTMARVSTNLFGVLKARPSLGRVLTEADAGGGEGLAGVLSHEYWRTRFGGDASVVGTVLQLEGFPVEVVGVLEPELNLPRHAADLWIPADVSREKPPVNWHRFGSVARLKEGVTVKAAERDLRRIMATFPEALPEAYSADFMERTGFDVAVTPLREYVVGDLGQRLWILLSAVALVLLIGCVNVVNLFLVRLESRRRERAVQAALGASRWDVARRWLAETGVLMAAAVGSSLLLASWGLALVLRMAPELPRVTEVGVGADTLLFTVAVGAVLTVVLGLVPALWSSPSMPALREGVGTATRHRNAVRGGLVALEMALALVVLVGAGLMLRSFHNLRTVDPGFEPEGALTVRLVLPAGVYQQWEPVAEYWRQATERVGALPGVAAVGATTQLPLVGTAGCAVLGLEDGRAAERNAEGGCLIDNTLVTTGYFEAMGIPVRGSAPTWEDMLDRRGQVVVSAPTAERLWPGERAFGQGLRPNGSEPPYYRVSGVAGPVRQNGLAEAPVERVYFPMLPIEGAPLWTPPRNMTLVVRSAGVPPSRLVEPVRGVLEGLDDAVAIGRFRPMTEVVADSMARTTFMMMLLGIAAAVSLALGVIGLYGVVAYVVEQRRSEIGIRMALGARAETVRAMVARQALGLALAGAVVGAAAVLAVGRVLESQLFEVGAADPLTLVGAAALLVGVAFLAALIPAARASRVQPMSVLRSE